MPKIIQKESAILREPAEKVPDNFFGTAKLKKIIADMSSALSSQDDGVAIAAPQIGVSWRLFIISGKLFTKDEAKKQEPDLVFINPQIVSLSKTKQEVEEGCLSVRWLYGKVKRANKATVSAYDFNGKKFTRSGSGIIAQIFQHEVDHLDGILFIDKAKKITEYQPESSNNL